MTTGHAEFTFKNNCFTEICSGFEAGSYARLIYFVYHSTLGLRVIKKRRRTAVERIWHIQDS